MIKVILIIYFVILLSIAAIFIFLPRTVESSEIITLPVGNHYYTTDWCPACQEQGKVIKELQELGYVIEIYNIDKDEGPFDDIVAIPFMIIVKIGEKGKQIILKLKGRQPIRKLIKLLQSDITPERS